MTLHRANQPEADFTQVSQEAMNFILELEQSIEYCDSVLFAVLEGESEPLRGQLLQKIWEQLPSFSEALHKGAGIIYNLDRVGLDCDQHTSAHARLTVLFSEIKRKLTPLISVD